MRTPSSRYSTGILTGFVCATGVWLSCAMLGVGSTTAEAGMQGQDISPTKARGGRGAYYPNTEDLAPDEMRIISLGTGMPNQRPSQKASSWLLELGNGDKFLFDLGTGSSDNLAALDRIFHPRTRPPGPGPWRVSSKQQ